MRLFGSILILQVILDFSFASLPQVAPIVWMETGIFVYANVSRDSIVIKIPDVCAPLRRISDVDLQRSLSSWCAQEKGDSLVKPLEKFCEPSYAQNQNLFSGQWRRSKRSPQEKKVDDNEYREPGVSQGDFSKAQNDIADLVRRASDATYKLSETNGKVAALEQGFRQLDSIVVTQNQNIVRMDATLARITSSTGDTVRIVAPLVTYFQETKDIFSLIKKDWSSTQGQEIQLNVKLMKVLQIDPTKREDFESVTINSCHVMNGVVHFDVNRTQIVPEIQVFKANPFTLYQIPLNSNVGVKLEYNGPKYAIYNVKSQCVIPSSDPSLNFPIVPEVDECSRPNPNAALQYWRMSCEAMYFYGGDTIQIKPVEDNYHVYCFGHSIMVFKKTIVCPSYVFSVHQNESFSIHRPGVVGEELGFDRVLLSDKTALHSEAISARLTNQLMPSLLKTLADISTFTGQCTGLNMTGMQTEKLNLGQKWSESIDDGTTRSSDDSSNLPLIVAIGALVVAVAALATGIYAICRQRRAEKSSSEHHPSQFPMLKRGREE